jgi:hypothetical protein
MCEPEIQATPKRKRSRGTPAEGGERPGDAGRERAHTNLPARLRRADGVEALSAKASRTPHAPEMEAAHLEWRSLKPPLQRSRRLRV